MASMSSIPTWKSQASLLRSREVLNSAVTSEEARRLQLLQSQVDPVAFLEDKLNVSHQANNELVKISLEWDDPNEARVLVRAIVNAYQKVIVGEEDKSKRERVADIRKLYVSRQQDLSSRMDRLATIKKNLQTSDSQQVQLKLDTMRSEVSTLQNQLSAISLKLIESKGAFTIHKAQEKALTRFEVDEEVILGRIAADPKVQQFKADMKPHQATMDAYKEIDKNAYAYRMSAKKVERIEDEINAREGEIRKSLQELGTRRVKFDYDSKLATLQNQVALLEAQEKTLRARLTQLQGQVISINESSTEKEMLEKDIARSEALLASMGNDIERSELDLHAGDRVSIAGGPALEKRSHKKRFLATFLGFGASAFWCLLRDRMVGLSPKKNPGGW